MDFAMFGKCRPASHWFVVRHPPALSHYQLPKYPLLLGSGLFEIHLGKGGHFVVTIGRKWMQSETTSSFSCGNCHRSRYKIGRFAKDYLQHLGPGPSRSWWNFIHMKKRWFTIPSMSFSHLHVPKTVSLFGYVKHHASPISTPLSSEFGEVTSIKL